ncbi:hypothetical protein CA13_04260 [Planctomycetes bacterium CA13]|uniref:Uncharacterized protein n=1 Tax=Novipirellula herctigrandis TaxID=2527986 RepID=A0A5C5YVE0_9BACT|nr:hypothetical protein CA13_04260 [Planctomycetes bacterium CA13]
MKRIVTEEDPKKFGLATGFRTHRIKVRRSDGLVLVNGDRVVRAADITRPNQRLSFRTSLKETNLLTERTIEKMFRQLMNDPNRNEETFDKAEELLEDELRAESPLRHRLTVELEELRQAAKT